MHTNKVRVSEMRKSKTFSYLNTDKENLSDLIAKAKTKLFVIVITNIIKKCG